MGKYDLLRDYLLQCGHNEITLSFSDIESIIGNLLPPSALKYDEWWANIGDSPHHSQAKSWHAAGYKAQADRVRKAVRFYRENIKSVVPRTIPQIKRDDRARIDPLVASISMDTPALREESDVAGVERIALISCSKKKKPYECRAKELYSASELFSLSYAYAKYFANRIYILSAKHGLVGEDEIIAPYDETLSTKNPFEKKAWSQKVLSQLKQVCDTQSAEFIILAGKDYYEYLLPELPYAKLPLGKRRFEDRIEFLRQQLADLKKQKSSQINAARLHQLFRGLPVYNWRTIDEIAFQDGIYIVFEKGENYRGGARIVRVGTHTSPGRLKQRLKDHFIRENHNGSIFRKNIGRAILNRDHDPYLSIWTLDTSKAPNIGKEDKVKETEIERRVSAYMREAFTFCVFKIENTEDRLRFEEAIIATLNRAYDFRASREWLGNSSPEWEIRQSGMWLKQGLDAKPLTDDEFQRLSQIESPEKVKQVCKGIIRPRELKINLK